MGHYVLSCDLQANDEDQTNHYQGDIFDVLNDGWDMGIFHPPCPKLSRAGARWLYAGGKINEQRYREGIEAKTFFMRLWNADIPRICVENPTPMKIFELPKESQVIQPYEYGHEYSKRTLLWLKGLPKLIPTDIKKEHRPFLPSNTGGAKRGQKATPRSISQKDSSKTFTGIAKAMASQWGNLLCPVKIKQELLLF